MLLVTSRTHSVCLLTIVNFFAANITTAISTNDQSDVLNCVELVKQQYTNCILLAQLAVNSEFNCSIYFSLHKI